jgi:mannose-1-phosphate guanylyltransferase
MSLRAMILGAGFGTRLRPLTEQLPKPLIPLGNRPLIHYGLDQLRAAGVAEVVVNTHHLAEQLPNALGHGQGLGLRLRWSPEQEILGTGGGLVRQREFLGSQTFYLLNGDVLSAVDLEHVLAFHRRLGAQATMVVRAMPAEANFTPLQMDEAGRLIEFKGIRQAAKGKTQACMFCGVHILEPAIFDHLPARGFACVNAQGYASMLSAGMTVGAYWYDGPWFDLGTPRRYLEANRALLSGEARLAGVPLPDKAVLVHESARIDATAEIGPHVCVGPDCRIGPGARIEDAVLWSGVEVAAHETIAGAIVTSQHRVSVD